MLKLVPVVLTAALLSAFSASSASAYSSDTRICRVDGKHTRCVPPGAASEAPKAGYSRNGGPIARVMVGPSPEGSGNVSNGGAGGGGGGGGR